MKRIKTGKWMLWGLFAAMGTLTCVTAWSLRPLPERVRTHYEGGKQVTETWSRTVALLPPRQWGFDRGHEIGCGPCGNSSNTNTLKLGFLIVEETKSASWSPCP